MSRGSAIEAIVKIAEEARDEEDFFNDITQALAEHGFVHEDDVAEGWHAKVGEECPYNNKTECDIDTPESESFCEKYNSYDGDICYKSTPATIREVLSGLAVRKES